ncbi:MAG TPA: serine hydrolase domain-containing protein [Marmoricola sp.]|nr:serine hydrolase domain-containing protein [Marmoricola sp.]
MVDGTCTDAFLPLRDLLEKSLAAGEDTGAAVAVVHDGELVVDIWGGEARPGVPWTRDTMTLVWSVSKTMAALAVLTLVERGELDLDAPVPTYWPDFAAHGKEHVLVRHLLGHTSGLPGWTDPITIEESLDLPLAEARLAAQEPWYEAGSAPAYQIINHGHLLDAVVRGATGRTLADVVNDDVMAPLGGGFRLGVPEDQLDLVADLIAPPGSDFDFAKLGPDHFLLRTVPNPYLAIDAVNGDAWRLGANGATGGHGHARGVALAQSALSHDGVANGVRLLSPATIARVFEVQAEGTDLVLARPVRFGIGYALPMSSAPAIPDRRVCWWSGFGGAIVVNDLDTRTTIAYTPNKLAVHTVASPRSDSYVRTALACVEGA